MKSITIFSNLAPLYISQRDGGRASTYYSLNACNIIKLENYKHTSMKGGII